LATSGDFYLAIDTCSSRSGAATCAPVRWTRGRRPGSTTRACTSSWALSATRRQRNHAQKTVGKPCAGKPHARIERGMGNQGRNAAPAPLTTNDYPAPGPRSAAGTATRLTPGSQMGRSPRVVAAAYRYSVDVPSVPTCATLSRGVLVTDLMTGPGSMFSTPVASVFPGATSEGPQNPACKPRP
jgi:hypothetical protein